VGPLESDEVMKIEPSRTGLVARHLWLTSVILTTLEAEIIRRITV
jgi:hypothetical protein